VHNTTERKKQIATMITIVLI